MIDRMNHVEDRVYPFNKLKRGKRPKFQLEIWENLGINFSVFLVIIGLSKKFYHILPKNR